MGSPEEEKSHKQAVRFSSQDEEIDPVASLNLVKTLTGPSNAPDQLDEEAQQELKNLSMSLQTSRIQSKRMENFNYEPVSLPTSRVPSPSSMRTSSLVGQQSASSPSPLPSPRPPPLHSPPLTPAGSTSREDRGKGKQTGETAKPRSDPALMTPQVSPPHEPPPTSIDDASHKSAAPPSPAPNYHSIPPPIQTSRPGHSSDVAGVVQPHPRTGPQFSLGPIGDSVPGSGEASPAGSPAVTPGGSTPAYSRPFTPQGDKDDPYARSKRAPQPQNLGGLDSRFIFGQDRRGQPSPSASTEHLPRPRPGVGDSKSNEEKRSSGFFGSSRKADKSDATGEKGHREELGGKHHAHGSMSELKRFFKIGGNKHHHKEKEPKRPASPAPSTKSSKSTKAANKTPPPTPGAVSVPFADDHGLQSKYGKFGKVLGSGAGGSVRLMKRSSDGVTFAVKQFRPRHSYETEKEYNKKVTAEFCIGSTLHHGNIIETMDLVHEKGNYYVVMEYAPFDLFAIVMTGKMSREEVTCCTLQIVAGVSFLHSMGLAHRDLKLDNVVVNDKGIMKIIDFGSAAVFRYPFENDIVLASGIVGSDPYLAPEVYDLAKYDPRPTDIWSLAIIFCCMTLRRFPWKAPRVSDNSYKLFVAPPNDGPRLSVGERSSASLGDLPERERRREGSYAQSEPASRNPSSTSDTSSQHHHHHHRNREEGVSAPASTTANGNTTTYANSSVSTASNSQSGQPQVIKGPWRLLRLLPRESRHIIGRMLEVDPRKRATLEEILADRWVTGASVCSQDESGLVHRMEGHDHTLEPGAGEEKAASKK